jgi:hypothetical protein
MKSFQMKALALAVLGLAGMGSAMACPTIVGGNLSTGGGGGAWSGQSVSSDTAFSSSAGLAGTTCGLGITVNTGALANTHGYVYDAHGPTDIGSRYRARAYFDISQLTLSLANYQTEIFNAFANTAPTGVNTDMIQVYIIGGGAPALRFVVADSTQASKFKTITQTLPSSANGHYYFEIDLNQGAPGSFRYWITPEGTASADATPTGTYAPTNTGWSGVMQANLGRYSTSANFRSSNVNKLFIVDEFDSRRTTFIGQ